MRRHIWAMVLMAILCGGAAVAQEGERPGRNPVEAESVEMQLRRQQLELEQAESEMAFEREMRELEIESRRMEIERERAPTKRSHSGCPAMRRGGPFMLICALINVLLAIWVFMDVRDRKTASGLWVVITLLAGFFGALVYAVVRLGDVQKRE